jgi:GTP-sensing pleiotropic transcriptional regulator CodY
MEPTLVATACMSMKPSRDLITAVASVVTGVVAEEGGVAASVVEEEGGVTGGVVVAVGVDLEAVVEGVTEAVVEGVRLSDRPLVQLVQVNNCLF